MDVCIRYGEHVVELCSQEMFDALFATISHHCEPFGWGSHFPVLMEYLQAGQLPPDLIDTACDELREARDALAALPPDLIVWNIESPDARAPWQDDELTASATRLSQMFVTADQRDLFAVLDETLRHAGSLELALRID